MHYRILRFLDDMKFRIAWWMPKWLVYYCSVRLMASATTGEYANTITPELNALDALRRWRK
jgi:hypothetical protein